MFGIFVNVGQNQRDVDLKTLTNLPSPSVGRLVTKNVLHTRRGTEIKSIVVY